IVGQQAMTALGGDYQQEVDLTTLFKDVAHEYVHMATDPAQIRHLVDRAVRIALDQRTVTCIVVPNDLAGEKAVESPPHQHGTVHSGIGYSRPKVVAEDGDLERAAAVLNESEKVAMLIGQGAMHAADEVVETAETLGAGVAKALLDDDPINPQRALYELSERLPDGAILTADSGSAANWYARDIKLRKGMMGALSGTLATMGPGVPYAVAAKFADRVRHGVALIG